MLERLFSLLDIVVLEPQAHGGFQGAAPFPQWFLHYHPDAKSAGTVLHFESPFLVDFTMKAASLWNSGSEGSMSSGSWTETDEKGNDWMLQASAAVVSGRKFLLIEPARVPLQEAQILLQKSREKSLDFRTVKRKQRSLRKVEQRYLTLLDAVPDWIFVVDRSGTILEYSSGREELFDEFKPKTGARLGELAPSDLSGQLMSQIENVISTGRAQMWRYRSSVDALEILILATGQDEAMCILRKKRS